MVELYKLAELIEEIQEKLAGIGFEDFRNNRKIKIETTNILQELLFLYEEKQVSINNALPENNWDEFDKFILEFIDYEGAINETKIWNFCKKHLRQLEKLIYKKR